MNHPVQALTLRACCDFCETREEIDRHVTRMAAIYGRDETGNEIIPPAGWKVIPFGAAIPALHREWLKGCQWGAMPRRGRSTMTPIYARPSGHVLAFAEPV